MLAMMKICIRQTVTQLRKQAPMFALLTAALVWLSGGKTLMVAYVAAVWILSSQVLALRIRERQEAWDTFLFTLHGRETPFYPAYLYGFVVMQVTTLALMGMAILAVLRSFDFPQALALEYSVMGGIAMAILLFTELQLLITEVLPIEQIALMQKLSLVVVVLGARFALDHGLVDFYSSYRVLLPAVTVFATVAAIPLARAATRRRYARL